MAEAPAGSDADAGSTLREWIRKVPEEVVGIARIDGTWKFKIELKESTIPSSLFIWDDLDVQLAMESSKSIRVEWNEEWMHDIPGDLEGDRIWDLARTLDNMIHASDNVVWHPESSSYAVGDSGSNHLCLEQACLDSKGTQCPRFAADTIPQRLAERESTNEGGRAETVKDAMEYVGKVVQDTYGCHPGDPGRMTVGIINLAWYNNPLRELMRLGVSRDLLAGVPGRPAFSPE